MKDLEICIRRFTRRVGLPLALLLVFVSRMVGLETKLRILNLIGCVGDGKFNEQSVLLQHKVS